MPNAISTVFDRTNAAKAEAGSEARAVVTKMSFGSGGLDGSGNPRIPLTTETGLQNKLLAKALETVSYPTATTVRFTARLATADGIDGADISEIGLEDAAGNTLAIKTFDAIPKNGENELVFDWDDAF